MSCTEKNLVLATHGPHTLMPFMVDGDTQAWKEYKCLGHIYMGESASGTRVQGHEGERTQR